MASPTEKTIKRLFALSGNFCAFPSCNLPIIEESGTVTGEICHIKASRSGGPRFDARQSEKERHGFDNLVLLCRHHHKIIDSDPQLYTADALSEMKAIHEKYSGRTEKEGDKFFAKLLINDSQRISISDNSGNVAINSPGAVQAENLSITTASKKISVNAPPGTIGADGEASRYVQYLINRYNKFAAAEPSRKTKFSHGAISRNIETTFGSQWKLLPMEIAPEVFGYLQGRIMKTRQARINSGKGHRSFRSYEEFLEK